MGIANDSARLKRNGNRLRWTSFESRGWFFDQLAFRRRPKFEGSIRKLHSL